MLRHAIALVKQAEASGLQSEQSQAIHLRATELLESPRDAVGDGD